MTEAANVVIIATHDSGRHFGCYGIDTVHTPEIDRLADDGYRFENAFTATPQCSPSRAAMLTGQYPQTNGVLGLAAEPWEFTLTQPDHHLSARLSGVGYTAALFGFQHEVLDVDDLAFDRVPEGGASPADGVADAFVRWIDEDPEEPFYAQINLFETHRPLDYGGIEPDDEDGVTVPPYLADNETARAEFAQLEGAVGAVDDAVGRIRRGLRSADLEDETILVFSSDHGISFSRAKGFLYDPGIEIPLVVRWPDGGIEGGVVNDRLVSNVDFVPTLLELLDLPAPDTDGTSFAGAFCAETDPHRDSVYAQFHDHAAWGFGPHARCIRTADYKLIRNFSPDMQLDPPVEIGEWDQLGRDGKKTSPRPAVELYDLGPDPNEFDNVADDPAYADIRERLDEQLWNWLKAVDDPVIDGVPATPYYECVIDDRPDEHSA